MVRPIRCVVGTANLDRLVETGQVADATAEQIRTFAEFLSKAGPPAPEGGPGDKLWEEWRATLTEEQVAFRRHANTDPGWREFLGLDR